MVVGLLQAQTKLTVQLCGEKGGMVNNITALLDLPQAPTLRLQCTLHTYSEVYKLTLSAPVNPTLLSTLQY